MSKWARSETYNHGLVMLPISMYLEWRWRADIFEFVTTRKENIETETVTVFDGSVQYTDFLGKNAPSKTRRCTVNNSDTFSVNPPFRRFTVLFHNIASLICETEDCFMKKCVEIFYAFPNLQKLRTATLLWSVARSMRSSH